MNSKGHWIIASYFFHDRGTMIQKSVEGFLYEILFQVLNQQRELFPLIRPIFTQWGPAGSDQSWDKHSSKSLAESWNIEDMEKALMLIANKSTFETNICLFVDALDEHDGNHRELISVLKHFTQSAGNSFFRVRLCLAGRPQNVFKDAFQSYPGFAIHEHTTQDIRLYAEERIHDGMGSKLTDGGAHELDILVQDIILRAKGVFLWVRLVVNELIDGLCEGDDIEELRNLLSTIPTELEDLYKRAIRRNRLTSLRRIGKHGIESYIMFQIVLHAKVSFSIYELLAATHFLVTEKENYDEFRERLSLDQMLRRLNSRSAGLLETLRDPTDVPEEGLRNAAVQFIHQTVKEFMLTSTGSMALREGLHDPPKDSGYLLIFRHLLSLVKCYKPGIQDFSAQLPVAKDFYLIEKFSIAGQFRYYAKKVDSETGRSAWHYLESSISSFTDQQLYEVFVNICRSFLDPMEYTEVFHMSNRRQVQIFSFLVYCDLPRSLGEFLSSRITEYTDEDTYQSFKVFFNFPLLWSHQSNHFCLEALLETGLGAKLSSDAFFSLDEDLQAVLTEDPEFAYCFENTSARQVWEQLRREKESSL